MGQYRTGQDGAGKGKAGPLIGQGSKGYRKGQDRTTQHRTAENNTLAETLHAQHS